MDEEVIKKGYIDLPLSPKDWVFGASSQIPYQNRNTTHNWLQFLSPSERQSGTKTDALDCVSFAKGQDIDAQINFLHASGLIRKEDWQKLINLGFVIDGVFVCSKRFIAKTSNTTPAGNSFGPVAEAVRSCGLLPEKDLPSEPGDMTWDEYYRELTSQELSKAKEILKIFTFPYHYLAQLTHDEIESALQMAPVQIATAVCAGWNTGDVIACTQPAQHSTIVYDIEDSDGKYLIQDHYIPFLKKLAMNYVIAAAMQTVVSPVNSVSDLAKTVPNSNPNLFNRDIVVGQTGDDVLKLRKALSKCGWNTDGRLVNDINNPAYDVNLKKLVFNWQLANLPRGLAMVGSSLFWEMVLNLKGKRFGPASRACMNASYDLWK